MSRTGTILPPGDDPDPTDRLPELDLAAAQRADDPLESTGTWAMEEALAAERVAELEEELAGRDSAISDLTSRMTQKVFALTRAEKELAQARAELLRAQQAAAEVPGLERRLHELELARAGLQAERDEQRETIGRLENQLSEVREAEGCLERRAEELAERLLEMQQACSVAEEKLAGSEARLAELEGRMVEATRETMTAAQQHEHDQLREHAAGLKRALDAAAERQADDERQRDALRQALQGRDAAAAEAAAALHERDRRIEVLLERLRNAEARRRIEADMRNAVAPAPAPIPAEDPPSIALARQLEEERSARQELEEAIEALQAEQLRPPPAAPVEPPTAPMRRRLLRLDPGHEAAFLLLPPRTSIGRTPESDLQLCENYISRAHAVVKLGADSTIIEDAGSRNGVFVNDRRVKRELLREGDIVMLGKARFRFESLAPDAG